MRQEFPCVFLPKVSLVSNTHIKYHVKFWVSMNWRLRGTCIQSDELIFFLCLLETDSTVAKLDVSTKATQRHTWTE